MSERWFLWASLFSYPEILWCKASPSSSSFCCTHLSLSSYSPCLPKTSMASKLSPASASSSAHSLPFSFQSSTVASCCSAGPLGTLSALYSSSSARWQQHRRYACSTSHSQVIGTVCSVLLFCQDILANHMCIQSCF